MELQNKLYKLNIKSSTEKIKKVINIFFTSKFIKRFTVTQGNVSYQGKRHSPEQSQSRLNKTFVSVAQLGGCVLNPPSPERKGNIVNYPSCGTGSVLHRAWITSCTHCRRWECNSLPVEWDCGGSSKQGLDPTETSFRSPWAKLNTTKGCRAEEICPKAVQK